MDKNIFKEGYRIKDQHAAHFLTFSVVGWIDLFTRKVYKDILTDSLCFCRNNKGIILNAFVIMSNHMHLIARAREEYILSDFIRDFKRHTHKTMMPIIQSELESRRLWMLHQFAYYAGRHTRNENFQIWTNNSHPVELVSAAMTAERLLYIHQNPVRAGIVTQAEHYLYSSASNYCGQRGVLEIDLL